MDGLLVNKLACARIPTDQGEFKLCLFENNKDTKEHLALIMGEVEGKEKVLVRVHSECLTGDVLGSNRCDCGEQLQHSMHIIAETGIGVLLYLRQEGRGIGLLDKLRAYNLQDQGYDTVEANLALGHQADEREYDIAAAILKNLNIRSIQMLTNNPDKIKALTRLGINVAERVSLETTVTSENARYLLTKVQRMNHLLNPDFIETKAEKRANGSHSRTTQAGNRV